MTARLVCRPRDGVSFPVTEVVSFYRSGREVRVLARALRDGHVIGCDVPASDFWIEGVAW